MVTGTDAKSQVPLLNYCWTNSALLGGEQAMIPTPGGTLLAAATAPCMNQHGIGNNFSRSDSNGESLGGVVTIFIVQIYFFLELFTREQFF